MTKPRLALSASGIALIALSAAPAFEQDTSTNDEAATAGNEIIVAERRAYRGDFEELAIPQANQTLDVEILGDVNALDLNTALDLSASVARQNNFGGLWVVSRQTAFVSSATNSHDHNW